MRWSVALELSDEIRQYLSEVQDGYRSECKEVSWLDPSQFFVIVKFLGNPRHHSLKKPLSESAAHVAPFDFELAQTGCFPDNERPRTLWVGIQEHGLMLEHFQKELSKTYRREDDNFRPHVVLGRISGKNPKKPIGKLFAQRKVEPLSQRVTEACLLGSKLRKKGPEYSVTFKAPFAATIAY